MLSLIQILHISMRLELNGTAQFSYVGMSWKEKSCALYQLDIFIESYNRVCKIIGTGSKNIFYYGLNVYFVVDFS